MFKTKNNLPLHSSCQAYQKGEVNLQTVFWVVGIIGGVVATITSVIPFFQNQSNTPIEPVPIAVTKEAVPIEVELKEKVSEKFSTKIGKYTVYANGTAVDTNTSMMWMRCSLGQEWDGTTCVGDAKKYTKKEAYQAIEQLNKTGYAGYYGWELPDIALVHSLLFCSNGYKDTQEVASTLDKKITMSVECDGNHQKPTINGNAFPNTETALLHGYWSATLDNKGQPLVMYFNTGKIKYKDTSHYVRVVRTNNPNQIH